MSILQIYENINILVPMEQRRFLDFYNQTILELCSTYSNYVLKNGKSFSPVESLSDDSVILPLYDDSILDNIIYLSGNDKTGVLKSEFLRKSSNAHTTYWNENAKNKHIKRARW